ncbi:hypothetical protein MLD38_028224 [Melastoma candidum]|uniref:Uncharacterized protein n=1 Tax=Melastoma candidum TaxID=119954 RepID=A0ACB9N1Y8_9MYRT|nr:hypothetical protein MLD38_028224 [Melastoma candidum]
METASATKTSRCLFIHRLHCHHHHDVHRHHHHHHHHHHHDVHRHHHNQHHCHHDPFHNRQQRSCHDPESLPELTAEQGDGFRMPPPPPEDENEDYEDDDEPVFVLTDEWREFFAKSEAKRRADKDERRKQAKNKGRNTE